jgi:hypothetical protein
MRDIAIKEAVLAAKLFLIRAKAFSDATRNPDVSYEYQGKPVLTYPSAPRESGALRRASLDLTRALAWMRKP